MSSSSRRSHELSTGMLVSGLPPSSKTRTPNMSSAAAPYTGGDIPSSGELARMFHIPIARPSVPPPRISAPPSAKMPSGPLLSPTGLITSGPIGEEKEAKAKEAAAEEGEITFGFWLPKPWIAVGAMAFGAAFGVGVFVWAAAGRPQMFVGFAGAAAGVGAVVLWNCGRGRRELERYFRAYPDSSVSLRNLPVGELVKVTGLVTCGSTPLDSSYQNVPRCAYTSIELYERKAWNLPMASYTAHSWTLRHSERHVADFYVSDLNSGTRVLVRAGNGAKVVSFIKPATTLHMSIKNKEQFPSFLRWLQIHNIPIDDLEMRFEEGYIREGSTVSVLGTLKTHENLIMIDPPDEASSTGWQWTRCFLPMRVTGLILIGDETPLEELCHV